jgi:hypothetical protein
MAGPGADVQEERRRVVHRVQVGQEVDGAVGQVLAEVVAVLERAWRRHAVVVVEERGHELVGLATVKAVPAVEAAAERPGGAGGSVVGLLFGAEVPFADRVGGIAACPQHLGEEPVLPRRSAPVPREARGQVGDPTHATAVVVASGEEAGPGGGAERGGVEVGQTDAVRGHTVDHRRVDVGAVTAELREPDVVEDDENHVGCPVGRCGHRGPPGLRGPPVVADRAAELDAAHRAPPLRVEAVDVVGRWRHGIARTRRGPRLPGHGPRS